MLGAAISTVTATALTAATSEIGVATTGGAGAGAVAVKGTSYTLSNISFSVTRYDMPSSYYDAVRSVLQSGATYKFYYPNYSCFQGIASSNKSGTTRAATTPVASCPFPGAPPGNPKLFEVF